MMSSIYVCKKCGGMSYLNSDDYNLELDMCNRCIIQLKAKIEKLNLNSEEIKLFDNLTVKPPKNDWNKMLNDSDSDSEESEAVKEQFLYLLTSTTHEAQNNYKIGLHTGTVKKLISRYKTYIIDPKIIRFIKCNEVRNREKEIHDILKTYRVDNTEWFKIDKYKLLNIFDNYTAKIPQYEKYLSKYFLPKNNQNIIIKLYNMIDLIDTDEIDLEKLQNNFAVLKQLLNNITLEKNILRKKIN